jgi:hypothetical protein
MRLGERVSRELAEESEINFQVNDSMSPRSKRGPVRSSERLVSFKLKQKTSYDSGVIGERYGLKKRVLDGIEDFLSQDRVNFSK